VTDVAPPPESGWFPDPARGDGLRYWNGRRWTMHATAPPGARVAGRPAGAASSTAVALTAALSVATFWIRGSGPSSHFTIVLPIGLVFMAWCLRLVARTRAAYARVGEPVPGHVNVARIVAIVLGVVTALAAGAAMLVGN
jgi:uncharacterized protein DUF2510